MPFVRNLRKAAERAAASGIVSGAGAALKSAYNRYAGRRSSYAGRPVRPSVKQGRLMRKRPYKGRKFKRKLKRYRYGRRSFAQMVHKAIYQAQPLGTMVKQWADVFAYNGTVGDFGWKTQMRDDSKSWAMFSPKYILDAASQLFDGKSASYDYTAAGGFSGRPKIYVEKNICTLEFVSQQNYEMELELYIIRPRDIETNASYDMKSTLDAWMSEGGTTIQSSAVGFYPEQFKSVRKRAFITKKFFKLKPDQKFRYTIYGRTGLYNLQNLISKDQQPGYTTNVFLRYKPTLRGGNQTGTPPTARSGFLGGSQAESKYGQGIVVYQRNQIDLRAPEGTDEARQVDNWINLETYLDGSATSIWGVNKFDPSTMLTNPN